LQILICGYMQLRSGGKLTELISFKEKVDDIFLILTQIKYRLDLGKDIL